MLVFPTPHFVGELHDHSKLRPLLVLGQHVAFLGRGKAALRRQAELIEGDVFGRLVDAALDVVLVLELAELRRNQPEHDLFLALREEA
jgi:hypothetical protein